MAKSVVGFEAQFDTSKAEGSVKSLKTQLKEAQADVQALSEKFGATSQAAIQAAKKAASLKDAIGDAKALTDAFNPDRKFQAFSGAIQGVVGGFAALQGAQALFGSESEELEKALVKVQAAMALSQGINSIMEAKDAFKILGTVISEISIFQKASAVAQRLWNAAMAANPIGAIIVAITALITGIVALVSWFKKSSDAAKAQAKDVDTATKAIEKQKKTIEDANVVFERRQKFQLDMAKASGMSADAIRKLEKKLIDEKIATAEATAKTALNTVEREKNRLAALKQAEASDEVIKKQEENLKSAKDVLKTANDDVVKANNEKLDLINRHQVEVKQSQTEANKKSLDEQRANNEKIKDNAQKEREAIQQANEKTAQETKALNDEIALLKIKDDDERAKAKLKQDYDNKIKEIEQSKANEGIKNKELLALKQKFELDLSTLENEIKDKKLKADLEKQNQIDKALTDARLAAITDENFKKQALIDIQRDEEIQKQADAYNQGLIDLQTYNNAVTGINGEFDKQQADLVKQIQDKRTADEKAAADARIKIAQDEAAQKVATTKAIGDAMGQLSEIIGKETAVGKGLAVAQATINTWLGATEVLRAKTTLPEPIGTISKIINVAAIVASGIKSVKSILATKVPGGGGGGGSAPSMPNAPLTPQVQTTQLNQGQVNQLSSATSRAFVLESDVSGSQERIQRINRAARIN